ncbi:unnamed protein product [Chrysoparadoxa australica]
MLARAIMLASLTKRRILSGKLRTLVTFSLHSSPSPQPPPPAMSVVFRRRSFSGLAQETALSLLPRLGSLPSMTSISPESAGGAGTVFSQHFGSAPQLLEAAVSTIDLERDLLLREIAALEDAQNESLHLLMLLRLEQFMARYAQLSALMDMIQDFCSSIGAADNLPDDLRLSLNRLSLDVLQTLQRLLQHNPIQLAREDEGPVGATPEMIEELPKLPPDSGAECAICLEESDKEQRVELHCHHSFHVSCATTWLLSNASCPTCRHSLLPTAEDSENKPGDEGADDVGEEDTAIMSVEDSSLSSVSGSDSESGVEEDAELMTMGDDL